MAQLVTMTIVFGVVFIYNTLRPAESHSVFGMVDGVAFSIKDPSALIDGQILREGEKIYGVRITKIYRDKVEFERDGERWEQRVRERPNRGWGEPNQPQEHTNTTN